MPIKKLTCWLLILASCLAATPRIIKPTRTTPSSFAIIVDRKTFARTEKAIRAYRSAVEQDGLATYILVDDWPDPETIRQQLKKLYGERPPLEGVVFIGDIPIPMIRDAQHLTSAFKMDQERYPFNRSSVPSDRYYDDFDLQFDFLQRDHQDTLLFYYSLRADSPQRINREIYSARIKPPVTDSTRYALIARYLERVAQQRAKVGQLDTMLTFHGHGYHSEALTAWQDQTFALREQLPHLTAGRGRLIDLHHTMQPNLKAKVLSYIQRPTLDLAIFHAHGEYEAQLLAGYPPAEMLDQNVEAIRRFLRNRLREARRRGQNIAEVKARYQQQYQFPDSWFADFAADSIQRADSLYAAMIDLYVADIEQLQPRAKLVIFDECFNGGFIRAPYIAGTYLFGNGEVIAAVANTVNVKQDIWADEYLGLLALGVRIGSWHRQRVFLESHLLGDPTLCFAALPGQGNYFDKWQKGTLDLAAELKSPTVVRRTWAVNMLYRQQGPQCAKQLVKIFHTDPAFNVRLEALKCLAALRSPEFEELLRVSVTDQYELIRRFSASWMGLVGRPEYLPYLAERYVDDPSERVRFVAKNAMEKISPRRAILAIRQVVNRLPASPYTLKLLEQLQAGSDDQWQTLLADIKRDSLSLKKRIEAARTFRNYQYQEAIPELIACARNVNYPPALRIALIEALGWFNGAHNRQLILDACEALLTDQSNHGLIAREALKTKRRLLEGPNEPCGW